MKKSYYDCKICLEECNEPIVTYCGHLYCWECIYKWRESKQEDIIPCPFCNSEVNIKKLIPIYTSKEEHAKNFEKIPQRPKPEQKQYTNNNNNNNNGENGRFNMHFNIFGFNMRWQNQNNNRSSCLLLFPFIILPIFMNIIYWFLDLILYPSDLFYNKPVKTEFRAYSKFRNLNNSQRPRSEFIFDNDDNFEDIGILFVIFIVFFIILYVVIQKMKTMRNRAQFAEQNIHNQNRQ